MSGAQVVAAVRAGTSMVAVPLPGSAYSLLFPEWGDIAYRLVLRENCTLSLAGGVAGLMQKMRVLIQQPPSGGWEITWPDNVIWTDGPPFVDSRSGSVLCVEFMFDGSSRYYGVKVFG
ncbi:hypothetical protein [Gluconobacter kondonii]|uniref:hypothetical protein n=1 Tax=Gluconobacter kondonii TaxID=941463 RepID=UPI0020121C94|nr:hypothetical protein [Gluconobacter kondonii]